MSKFSLTQTVGPCIVVACVAKIVWLGLVAIDSLTESNILVCVCVANVQCL